MYYEDGSHWRVSFLFKNQIWSIIANKDPEFISMKNISSYNEEIKKYEICMKFNFVDLKCVFCKRNCVSYPSVFRENIIFVKCNVCVETFTRRFDFRLQKYCKFCLTVSDNSIIENVNIIVRNNISDLFEIESNRSENLTKFEIYKNNSFYDRSQIDKFIDLKVEDSWQIEKYISKVQGLFLLK